MVYRRKNRQNEIAIALEDVELIMGKNYPNLNIFLSSSFCVNCARQITIKEYRIFLDDTNDIVLDGYCEVCNNPVTRYIETGESHSSAAIATHIRAVKKL